MSAFFGARFLVLISCWFERIPSSLITAANLTLPQMFQEILLRALRRPYGDSCLQNYARRLSQRARSGQPAGSVKLKADPSDGEPFRNGASRSRKLEVVARNQRDK